MPKEIPVPFVKYVGDDAEVVTPANGGIPVARGEVIELDDQAAAGLVGYGDSLWHFVDPEADESDPTPEAVADVPVDAAPAEEN